MKFNTPFVREAYEKEKNDGTVKVEKVGYIPPQVQIERMIMAGARLDMSRGYDTLVVDEEPEIDPTRSGNYDLADATIATQMLSDKLDKDKKNSKKVEKSVEKSVKDDKIVSKETENNDKEEISGRITEED